jgi:hypothetical protein
VNAASGEFEDSGNPAKNGAVSSTVPASEPREGAALSVSVNVTKTALKSVAIPVTLSHSPETEALIFSCRCRQAY